MLRSLLSSNNYHDITDACSNMDHFIAIDDGQPATIKKNYTLLLFFVVPRCCSGVHVTEHKNACNTYLYFGIPGIRGIFTDMPHARTHATHFFSHSHTALTPDRDSLSILLSPHSSFFLVKNRTKSKKQKCIIFRTDSRISSFNILEE